MKVHYTIEFKSGGFGKAICDENTKQVWFKLDEQEFNFSYEWFEMLIDLFNSDDRIKLITHERLD